MQLQKNIRNKKKKKKKKRKKSYTWRLGLAYERVSGMNKKNEDDDDDDGEIKIVLK